MVHVTNMRLAFEAAVRTSEKSPVRGRVIGALKRRIGVSRTGTVRVVRGKESRHVKARRGSRA